VEPALTARKYKWQADSNAPETQIGFITVNFKPWLSIDGLELSKAKK
jgi:hypothetical protein